MAVRGKYTDEEKKLLSEVEKWIGETVYIGEECHPGNYEIVNNRVATGDLIRRYAHVFGDDNPLWLDDVYARNTRYGRIIAPPFFLHCIAIGSGSGRELPVTKNMGQLRDLNIGGTWQFFRPVYINDSFRVRDVILNSIEDKTRLDGKGPRQFLTTSDRTYINQKDEIVCTVSRRMMSMIIPNPTDSKEVPMRQGPVDYEYTREELEAIDRTLMEEERRGANPRYWEDVAVGDDIKPVVFGPNNINDQVLAYSLQGWQWSTRSIRKECMGNPDVEAAVNIFMSMTVNGSIRGIFGTQMDSMIGLVITNWIGDDGFLKKFNSQNRMTNPSRDANWARGKVIKKYIEGDEHLVDLAVWLESVRGWIVTPATATVVLPSRTK